MEDINHILPRARLIASREAAVVFTQEVLLTDPNKSNGSAPHVKYALPPLALEAVQLSIFSGLKTAIIAERRRIDKKYQTVLESKNEWSLVNDHFRLIERKHSPWRKDKNYYGVFVCPHTDAMMCSCRFPEHGLIVSVAETLSIEEEKIYLIGKSPKSFQATRQANCTFVNINTAFKIMGKDIMTTPTLRSAIEWIVSKENKRLWRTVK